MTNHKKTAYGVWVPFWIGRPKLRDRILNMYRTYGVLVTRRDEPDRRCKECEHLVVRRTWAAGTVRRAWKCKMSAVPDWNWRQKWPACGLFGLRRR